MGGIDFVFLNHLGRFYLQFAACITDETLIDTANVDFVGMMILARDSLPHLEKTGGTLAYTSSGSVDAALPGLALYRSVISAQMAVIRSTLTYLLIL